MKTKLEKFIKRNKRRNFQLYENSMVEGIDYIICPVSNERLSMIKTTYIEKILNMTVEDYDKLYPGVRTVSKKRILNISKGLRQIDSKSGLTKYEISQNKAKIILSTLDEDGVSGYKKKGEKTRRTHLANIDSFGRNGYSRLASKAIIKGNLTKAKNGLITFEDERTEYDRYRLVVEYITNKYKKEITEGYLIGRAGTGDVWQVDHRYSVLKGYKNNVSPFIIGHKINLEMLPWKENISKREKCSITLDDLLLKTEYSLEKSQIEFNNIIEIIRNDIKMGIPPNAAYVIERYLENYEAR